MEELSLSCGPAWSDLLTEYCKKQVAQDQQALEKKDGGGPAHNVGRHGGVVTRGLQVVFIQRSQ